MENNLGSMKLNPSEETEMADSSLNATEIAVGSLLAGNAGGYGGGYGAWGGGGAGFAPFASPGSNAVRINRNNEVTVGQAECTREVLGRDIDRISDQAEEGRRSAQFTSILKAIADSEFRSLDRQRDIEREINANARAAAECCCDLKLQACQDKSEILTAIADSKATALAVESRAVERALNNANAELTALKTQIACGCCPPRA